MWNKPGHAEINSSPAMPIALSHVDNPGSVFRTHAWVQAWIDTWGANPAITLIDLGGRNNPLEHVYLSRHYLKGCIPIKVLGLAGIGSWALSTPRAEYNDLQPLITMAGDISALGRLLASLPWQRFFFPDAIDTSETPQQLHSIAQQSNSLLHIAKREHAYQITPRTWDNYIATLGKHTRLRYVNRRKNLQAYGVLELEDWSGQRADEFFRLLNKFHVFRWNQPCFSIESQEFLKNFGERLSDEQGRLQFNVLKMNGDVVAVLLNINWNGIRYNLQSGFKEQGFPKIALGALHMGYDIESALQQGYTYDFMAGEGKHSNYKAHIATNNQSISSYFLERSFIKFYRQIKRRISI